MGIAIVLKGNIDFSNFNLGGVTPINIEEVPEIIPITGISISGNSIVNGETSQYNISYTPTNTTQKGVSWSVIEGNDYVSINNNGILTIVEGANNNKVTIKATSIKDNSVYATKTIYVTNVVDNPQPETKISVYEFYGDANTEGVRIPLLPNSSTEATPKNLTDGFIIMMAYDFTDMNTALVSGKTSTYPIINDGVNTPREDTYRYGIEANKTTNTIKLSIGGVNVADMNKKYAIIKFPKDENAIYYYNGTNWVKAATYDKSKDDYNIRMISTSYAGKYHVKFYYTSDISNDVVTDFINKINDGNYNKSWLLSNEENV